MQIKLSKESPSGTLDPVVPRLLKVDAPLFLEVQEKRFFVLHFKEWNGGMTYATNHQHGRNRK